MRSPRCPARFTPATLGTQSLDHCLTRRRYGGPELGHNLAPEAEPLENGVWEACKAKKRKSWVSGGPGNPWRFPHKCPLEWQPPLASHSLRYAGRDEGHSSSATRRTKNFMGIIHSTPPCVGTVLGHQAGYLSPKGEGVGGTTDLAQGPRRPATVVPSTQAQKPWVGERGRERPWPRPLLAPHTGGGATAPGPALLNTVAKPWKPLSREN